MLPGDNYLGPGRDGVRPLDQFNSRSDWLDEHNVDMVAIDLASAIRTTSDQQSPGGVRTESTLVAAAVSHSDDADRNGNMF